MSKILEIHLAFYVFLHDNLENFYQVDQLGDQRFLVYSYPIGPFYTQSLTFDLFLLHHQPHFQFHILFEQSHTLSTFVFSKSFIWIGSNSCLSTNVIFPTQLLCLFAVLTCMNINYQRAFYLIHVVLGRYVIYNNNS